MISCSASLLRLLERYGVDTVFGIPGVHTIEFYRELPSTRIRHITPRHEQGAGFMADGYARVTGKPGVCFLITGPGVTNAATALAEAYSDSVPVLAISSVNQTSELGIGGGRLHELPSQHKLTSSFTVFSHTLLDPAELPHVLARAFAVFSSGRPGPVHIEIPINLLTAEVSDAPIEIHRVSRPGPEPGRVEKAAALLADASSPIVILGGGAVDASADATRLVESLQCPVVSTVAGKGVVDEFHPLSLGATLPFEPVRDMIGKADVVLAVGTEFAETDLLYTGKGPEINGDLIRVDIEAEQLVRNFFPRLPILSDARLALDAINRVREGTVPKSSTRDARTEVGHALADLDWLPKAARHQKVLDVLAELLPENNTIVCDSTQLAYTGYHYYRCRRPRQWLFPLGFGTLGYGLPAALGAKLGTPEDTIVCLAGDGGFLFTVEELAAGAEYELPVTVIVWNNDGYGEIRDAMIEAQIPEIGVNLKTPDFVGVARAFGCLGFKPGSLEELKDALLQSFDARVPTLIEVHEEADYLVDHE
jgi:acetolactate synthase-1/2/3 large subunit